MNTSEFERTKWFGDLCWYTSRDLNGNTYILVMLPPNEEGSGISTATVRVYAAPDGEDHGFPHDHPADLGSTYKNCPYNEIVAESIKGFKLKEEYGEFYQFVSEVLNEAVCERQLPRARWRGACQ